MPTYDYESNNNARVTSLESAVEDKLDVPASPATVTDLPTLIAALEALGLVVDGT